MIRIGVFSDSHGDTKALARAFAHARAQFGPLDYVIHCGDGAKDLLQIDLKATSAVYAVRGNCDFDESYAKEKHVEIAERSVFICHGHQYDVKFDKTRLFYKSLELGAHITFFGHTHIAEIIENEGLILFNPGSVTRPKIGQTPSYGLVEIEHKILNCRIINFE